MANYAKQIEDLRLSFFRGVRVKDFPTLQKPHPPYGFT
jgi:hypothetical protein